MFEIAQKKNNETEKKLNLLQKVTYPYVGKVTSAV